MAAAEADGHASPGADRRVVVLAAALEAFVRYGYRKTSMEDIAVAARISRPGLYFLFTSKRELFAAAVGRALDHDLRAAACSLGDEARPLQERLLEAFDTSTGRYLGAVGGELSGAGFDTATVTAQDLSSGQTRRTRGGDFQWPPVATCIGHQWGLSHGHGHETRDNLAWRTGRSSSSKPRDYRGDDPSLK